MYLLPTRFVTLSRISYLLLRLRTVLQMIIIQVSGALCVPMCPRSCVKLSVITVNNHIVIKVK